MFSIVGSICVGDKTSCGGTVISGSPFSEVGGRMLARVGDRVACRKNCVIVNGNPTEIIDGAPMALHGSQTSGNCTCISGNNDIHGDAHTPAAAAGIPVAADSGIAFMPDTAALLDENQWVDIQLSDSDGKPIPLQPFVLTMPTGVEVTGTLDESGYARVSPVKAGVCTVRFPELNHSMNVSSCQL